MAGDPADWPDVRPPEGLDGEQSVGGQRERLRAAIERLRAARDSAVAPGKSNDRDDQQATEADMLGLLLALEGAADEGQHRLLPED